MTVVVNDNVTLISGKAASSAGGTDWLCLHVDSEPLVGLVEDFDNKMVTVRYWISTTPLTTVEEATEQTLEQVMGLLDAKIDHAYSECTGYLWTEEHLKVGGHNILSEIWERCELGRWGSTRPDYYVLLEVTVHEASN